MWIKRILDLTERDPSKTVALALWLGLVILSVLLVGLGLIMWASRRARQIARRRKAEPTVMRDIWFLNPPEKRKGRDE